MWITWLQCPFWMPKKLAIYTSKEVKADPLPALMPMRLLADLTGNLPQFHFCTSWSLRCSPWVIQGLNLALLYISKMRKRRMSKTWVLVFLQFVADHNNMHICARESQVCDDEQALAGGPWWQWTLVEDKCRRDHPWGRESNQCVIVCLGWCH
jgi:hypothetical protein